MVETFAIVAHLDRARTFDLAGGLGSVLRANRSAEKSFPIIELPQLKMLGGDESVSTPTRSPSAAAISSLVHGNGAQFEGRPSQPSFIVVATASARAPDEIFATAMYFFRFYAAPCSCSLSPTETLGNL